MKWKVWTWSAVVAAALVAAQPRARAAPATQSAPPPPSPQQLLQTRLDSLKAALRTGSQAQRDEAAAVLAETGGVEARDAITAGLSAADEKVQLACARAIADHGSPEPTWLPRLVALLQRDRQFSSEAAARALSRYDADVRAYGTLIQFARDPQHNHDNRTAAIRALGQMVQKPVAEALLGFVRDAGEDAQLRAAGGEALGHLSGHPAFGRDPQLWSQWWGERQARAPADWRAQVLGEQHPALEHAQAQMRDQLRQLQRSLRALLFDQYQHVTPAERTRKLLAYLNDPDPGIREAGASVVLRALQDGQPITEEPRKRLIELLADGSPDVRLQVAQTIAALSDPTALDAVLTQLQVEHEQAVQLALIDAAARIRDVRAVPVLQKLLHDQSAEVVIAAANALKALAPEMKDRNEARRLWQELEQVLDQRTGPPGQPNGEAGTEELRIALVAAMAPVGAANPNEALNFFPALLNQNESAGTRAAALEALGSVGERAGDFIIQSHELDPNFEPDPGVRQAAVIALGEVGSFNYAGVLDQRTRAPEEPDARVREAAWKAFEGLLPAASPADLNQWADNFRRRKEPDREAVVLTSLLAKLKPPRDAESLAIAQERLGDLYLSRDLNQPEQAIPYLKSALDYWQRQTNARPQSIAALVTSLMNAYLAGRQYRQTAQFAEEEIRISPTHQEEVGPAIRNAVDGLISKATPDSYRDAALLIHEALQMKPPLVPDVVQELERRREQLPSPTTQPAGGREQG